MARLYGKRPKNKLLLWLIPAIALLSVGALEYTGTTNFVPDMGRSLEAYQTNR